MIFIAVNKREYIDDFSIKYREYENTNLVQVKISIGNCLRFSDDEHGYNIINYNLLIANA